MEKRISISDKNKHLIKRIVRAVFGNILFAFAINVIITPLNLYSSGFTGIAMLLRMFFVNILKIPVIPGVDYLGIIYYTINIPLLILAYKVLGKEFTVTSMLSIALTSTAMIFIPVPTKPLFDDLLTGSLVGGIVSGTAAGIVLKGGTSAGGQDIIGVAMSKAHPNFSVGRITIFINSVIYGICFFLFDIQIVVYSLIFAVANAIALDYQHTQNINVQVMIFTKKEGITDRVINELKRGLTYWRGAGGYTDEDTYVLMTVCSKYELPSLIQIVKSIDSQAFVMVNEGTKIYGNFEKRFTE